MPGLSVRDFPSTFNDLLRSLRESDNLSNESQGVSKYFSCKYYENKPGVAY